MYVSIVLLYQEEQDTPVVGKEWRGKTKERGRIDYVEEDNNW